MIWDVSFFVQFLFVSKMMHEKNRINVQLGQVSSKLAAVKNGQVSSKFAAANNGQVSSKFAAAKNGQVSSKFTAVKMVNFLLPIFLIVIWL